jgi:SHS2 domain-containing protein
MLIPFEQLSHTADIKIKVTGKNESELFINAMRGMFSSCQPILNEIKPMTTRLLSSKADTFENLLITFLSDCLYLSDVHNEIYFDGKIDFHNNSIHAQLVGTPINGFQVSEIKAVTYHDFSLKKLKNHWEAIIVFDI